MRFIRSIATTAAALAVALAAAGCTGTDTTAPTTTTTATAATSPSVTTASPTQSPTGSPTLSPTTATTEAPSPSVTRSAQAEGTKKPASAGTALAALETLDVKSRAPKTGYDRDQFGPAWADTDRNGCDTRNDILARDLTNETYKPGTGDCVVATGVLDDPYTATEIHFVRGQDTSTAVQVDHVVALSDAWQKGA